MLTFCQHLLYIIQQLLSNENKKQLYWLLAVGWNSAGILLIYWSGCTVKMFTMKTWNAKNNK